MSTAIEASPGLLQASMPSASFARPANTTPYSAGNLVANSATAASVVPMSFNVEGCMGRGKVRRARIAKSNATLTNAQFQLHLYSVNPCAVAPTNGDGGAWVTSKAGWLGSLSLGAAMKQAFTDGAEDIAVPDAGTEIIFSDLPGPTAVLYGLLVAKGAYAPASAETFSVTLEIAQI